MNDSDPDKTGDRNDENEKNLKLNVLESTRPQYISTLLNGELGKAQCILSMCCLY